MRSCLFSRDLYDRLKTYNNQALAPRDMIDVQTFMWCTYTKGWSSDEIAKAESGAFILVMTHDHSLDLALVHAALGRSDFPYVGLIGSKTKKQRFINRLQESGIDENDRARLICPVGITRIESKHPAQIATASAAQLLMERQTNDL